VIEAAERLQEEHGPIKVAIVGGGCAAMAAAFELSRPEHRGTYRITVYQLGWRLGGKGASGRGPADRIEEHGLHLWMGWYENAFRLMRECYAELDRDPTRCHIASWRDAFEPAPFVGVTDRLPNGEWSFWRASLPVTPGLPGDPYPDSFGTDVLDYLLRSLQLVRTLLTSLPITEPGSPTNDGGSGANPLDAETVAERIARMMRFGELGTLAATLEAIALLERTLASPPDNLAARFTEAIGNGLRSQLASLVDRDPEMRRLWTIVDLTLASVRGMLLAWPGIQERGFDALDDYDCREWLLLNGASKSSVESGYLAGLYDLGFSYEDGDPQRPRIAAGQALRAMFRAFFTYRGAFFWRMRSGMGDVVFAPLYEVLRRRGVRFEFFHRLENVHVEPPSRGSDARGYVASLDFDVQAQVRGGKEYEPLVDVRGLPCWPASPDFAQLVDGGRLRAEGVAFESFWDRRCAGRRMLRVREDFDLVVLGVGLGAVPQVCREIVAHDPDWKAMVQNVKTVATQAFQVWMRSDLGQLGWAEPPINISGFVKPFDTWADMRHLIREESFGVPPGSLSYFCSVLPDIDSTRSADYPLRQREQVRRNAVRFLERDVRQLWPGAVDASGRFRWEELVDPAESAGIRTSEAGAHRFASQFYTANVNPSDRYALSLPGTQVYRLSPLARHYDNLTICGDWTDCGFNAGCVEAAVMSGRLAAHALSKSPPLEDIVGFHHP
jgi:uncharacterized protein with NAD-binding domain and iron-sulfur cluster